MTLRFRFCVVFLGLALSLIFLPAVSAQDDSQKETEAIDFAHGLLESGLYDMALAEYQKFIADYPQSAYQDEAHFFFGETYFQSQQFPQAIDAFNAVKQKFPDSKKSVMAILRIGQILIQQGNMDAAYQELSSIDLSGRLQGESLQSYYFYSGKAALGKNDPASALNFFEKAAQVADAKQYLSYALGQIAGIQAQDGHFSEAADAMTKALASTEDAALKGELTYKLGEILFRSARYEESVSYFRQVLDQYPGTAMTFQAVSNLLLAYWNMKKYEEVRSAYQNYASLIKDDGTYFETHVTVARALSALQRHDESLALINKAMSFSGVANEAICRGGLEKADILIQGKKYQEGLNALESDFSACAPTVDRVAFLKAQANFGIGQYEKSFELFSEVKSNFPDSPYASAAWIGMAHSRQESGEGQAAADLFLAYADKEEDVVLKSEAIFYAAIIMSQGDTQEKAIEQAQRYLKEYPQGFDYENVILLLGELYARTGQYDQAVTLLQGHLAAPDRVKRSDKVQFLIGYNLQLAGKVDAALNAYTGIKADPNDAQFFLAGLKNSTIIFLNRQEESKAAELFDRMMMTSAQNGLDFKTYLWVCDRYLKDGKFQDALRIADQASAHDPDQPAQILAYFKAEAYRGLNDFDSAQKFYETALASSEKNVYTSAAQIGKGLNFLAANKLDEAQRELEKAIEDNPEDHTVTLRARFEIGNIARLQNRLEEALKLYLMVGTIYDDDVYCPRALMSAGEILEGFARKEEALKTYREVASKYPASAQAAQAQEKISSLK